MGLIVKTVLIIVTWALLCHYDNIDPNSTVHIPDNNYLNALIELGVDTKGDDKNSLLEPEVITFLHIIGKKLQI